MGCAQPVHALLVRVAQLAHGGVRQIALSLQALVLVLLFLEVLVGELVQFVGQFRDLIRHSLSSFHLVLLHELVAALDALHCFQGVHNQVGHLLHAILRGFERAHEEYGGLLSIHFHLLALRVLISVSFLFFFHFCS